MFPYIVCGNSIKTNVSSAYRFFLSLTVVFFIIETTDTIIIYLPVFFLGIFYVMSAPVLKLFYEVLYLHVIMKFPPTSQFLMSGYEGIHMSWYCLSIFTLKVLVHSSIVVLYQLLILFSLVAKPLGTVM